MYQLTEQRIIEVAADLLQCSTERVRVRARLCLSGGKIAEDESRVNFCVSVGNPWANLNVSENGYTFQKQYNNSRFKLRGVGVWFPDRDGFFFSECIAAPDTFVYLELSRF